MIVNNNTHVEQGYFTHQHYWKLDHAERVVDQLLQEMAELQKELLKDRLGRGDKQLIIKEMADVLLCLEFLGRDEGVSAETLRSMMAERAVLVHLRLTDGASYYGYWSLTGRTK